MLLLLLPLAPQEVRPMVIFLILAPLMSGPPIGPTGRRSDNREPDRQSAPLTVLFPPTASSPRPAANLLHSAEQRPQR